LPSSNFCRNDLYIYIRRLVSRTPDNTRFEYSSSLRLLHALFPEKSAGALLVRCGMLVTYWNVVETAATSGVCTHSKISNFRSPTITHRSTNELIICLVVPVAHPGFIFGGEGLWIWKKKWAKYLNYQLNC